MSRLILTKSIHVCYMINPWFTKLVGSRWLVVMPVLFCLAVFLVLFLPIYAPWAIRMRKKKKNCHCVLPSCPHAWLITHIYLVFSKIQIMLFKLFQVQGLSHRLNFIFPVQKLCIQMKSIQFQNWSEKLLLRKKRNQKAQINSIRWEIKMT